VMPHKRLLSLAKVSVDITARAEIDQGQLTLDAQIQIRLEASHKTLGILDCPGDAHP